VAADLDLHIFQTLPTDETAGAALYFTSLEPRVRSNALLLQVSVAVRPLNDSSSFNPCSTPSVFLTILNDPPRTRDYDASETRGTPQAQLRESAYHGRERSPSEGRAERATPAESNESIEEMHTRLTVAVRRQRPLTEIEEMERELREGLPAWRKEARVDRQRRYGRHPGYG